MKKRSVLVVVVLAFAVAMLASCGGGSTVDSAPVPMAPTPAGARTGNARGSSLGTPMSIDDARRRPGIYIMEGDLFTLIRPANLARSMIFSISDDTSLEGHKDHHFAIDVAPDSNVLQLSNNAQLVIISDTSVSVVHTSKVHTSGYTIPYFIYSDESTIRGPSLSPGYRETGERIHEFWFNEVDPPVSTIEFSTTQYRSIGDRQGYKISTEVVSANLGDEFEFTYGRFEGTQWVADTFPAIANQRFFIADGFPRGYVGIEQTMNGYFKIVFPERFIGYYILSINNIGTHFVEFID